MNGLQDKTTLAIEAAGLVKRYPGDVLALDDLGFEVRAGTVFGLLGPNGAGKSTTVKVLTTLARPDAGTARVAGRDVLADPVGVRRTIGVVAQRTGTDPDATGRENLVLQGRLYGGDAPGVRARADELLARFGVADAADRLVRTWSGGMVRRLDIAMGLITRPQVLFLDEPTTGLDPEIRAAMWDELRRLRAEEDLTILLTTHYLDEADQLADRLAIVDHGRVVVEGTPEELKRSLQGESVTVELRADARADGEVSDLVRALPGVRDVVLEGTSLHARVDAGATAAPTLLAALEARQVPVASLTIARPSLDDVYLQHTGRTFAA